MNSATGWWHRARLWAAAASASFGLLWGCTTESIHQQRADLDRRKVELAEFATRGSNVESLMKRGEFGEARESLAALWKDATEPGLQPTETGEAWEVDWYFYYENVIWMSGNLLSRDPDSRQALLHVLNEHRSRIEAMTLDPTTTRRTTESWVRLAKGIAAGDELYQFLAAHSTDVAFLRDLCWGGEAAPWIRDVLEYHRRWDVLGAMMPEPPERCFTHRPAAEKLLQDIQSYLVFGPSRDHPMQQTREQIDERKSAEAQARIRYASDAAHRVVLLEAAGRYEAAKKLLRCERMEYGEDVDAHLDEWRRAMAVVPEPAQAP